MGRRIAERTVSVALQANVKGFIAGMQRARAETASMAGALARHARDNEQAWDRTGKALLGVGLAAGAGVAAAAVKFASFDKQMSAVQAATLATAEDMDRLRDAAVQAGADTAFSANQAAQGIEELAKAGVSTEDIIGGGLTGALDLAAAGGLDVAQAAEIAATAVVQFGLRGDQVVDVADALAAGANKAQGSVQDLGLALSYAGVPANALGLSVEETTGVLALFANAGIIGEKAGTAFRAMLVSLQNPSAKAKTLMDELGIEVFDAQGKFIGMEGTAGVLQDRLSGLTDQQRGSALATIFGNESLGAATTLYKGGAEAVATWTENVSESGYAAEVAATRLDNLYGDVEALSGSFETLMIRLGEGGNGPLREWTQDVTTLVNVFAEMSPAAQQAGLAAAGVTAAVGIAGGAALVAVPKVMALYGALQGMGPAGMKAAAGMRAVGAAAGPIGLALTGITVVGGVLFNSWVDQKQAVEEYRASLDEMTGALTEGSRKIAARALEDAGALEAAQRLGIQTSLLTDALMGNADAQEIVNTKISEARAAYNEGNTALGGYATSQGTLRGDADLLTGVLEEQNGVITTSQEEFRRLAAAEGETSGAANKAAIEHAEMTGAIAGAGEASDVTSAQTDSLTGSVEDAASAAETAEEQISELDKALDALFGAELSVQEATDATEQAIADLSSATKEAREDGVAPLTESVYANSEAGRVNRESINATMRTIGEEAQVRAAQGEGIGRVTGRVYAARDALIAEMVQMGYTREEAIDYTGALNAIPSTVETLVTTPGMAQAKADADYLKASLDNIPKNIRVDIKSYTSAIKQDIAMASRGPQGDAPGSFTGTMIGGKALARVQSTLPSGLRITSTYRSPAKNASVGGSPTSKHMDARNPAVDIAGSVPAMDAYARKLAQMGNWRQLLYRVKGHYDHIHVAHTGAFIHGGIPRQVGDKADERTIRTQVGERVLSREQNRAYEAGFYGRPVGLADRSTGGSVGGSSTVNNWTLPLDMAAIGVVGDRLVRSAMREAELLTGARVSA